MVAVERAGSLNAGCYRLIDPGGYTGSEQSAMRDLLVEQ